MKKAALQIIVKDDLNHMARTAAELFTDAAIKKVKTHNLFTVALSGGSTPRALYNLLTEEPLISRVPWKKTHFFWVDERLVPRDHPYSNYGSVQETFIDKIPIPESHVHPMPVAFSPETASKKYGDRLMRFFDLEEGTFPRLDLIMLGMGKDGHTASLFPGQRALDERKQLVISVKGGDPFVNRLTLTFPVLNNAMEILVLVSGEDKADTLKAVLEEKQNALPAQRIGPTQGTLKWLMDRKAASRLSNHLIDGKF